MGIGDYVHETHQGSQIPQVTVQKNITREVQFRLGTKKYEDPKIPPGWEHYQSEKESCEGNTQTLLMLYIGQ